MKTILIVEDDVSLCRGIRLYLEEKGHDVLSAHSIQEAKRITDHGRGKIALILLDCNLPDGDGMEFCRELRQGQEVPVIFLTARDTEEDMIRGFRAGADGKYIECICSKASSEAGEGSEKSGIYHHSIWHWIYIWRYVIRQEGSVVEGRGILSE